MRGGVRARAGVRAAAFALALLALALSPAGSAAASRPSPARASLPAIERRVMCVTCKIPLIVAESPQAERERVYIRGLIAQGRSEAQIEAALVGQYGPTVLGLPRARGFDLAAYLAPLAAVLALLGALALLLARWRRRGRRGAQAPDPPALSTAQAARLDADLARFER